MSDDDDDDDHVYWLYHDGFIHAFVMPADRGRGTQITSACGHHVTRTSGTKAMGAAQCLDCAEALGMQLSEEDKNPPRGLGYRRHRIPENATSRRCTECKEAEAPWPDKRDTVGRTPSGLVAPQSAIDAMRKNGT